MAAVANHCIFFGSAFFFISSLFNLTWSQTLNPVHIGKISEDGALLLSGQQSVFVSGNYAYVIGFKSHALEIVDISDPSSPVHKGSLTNGSGGALLNSPLSVYVLGNYAYVTSAGFATSGLEIIDVTNPSSPVHKGSIINGVGGAQLSFPYSVYVSGNYAYVTSSNSNALEIVDITDPFRLTYRPQYLSGIWGGLYQQHSHGLPGTMRSRRADYGLRRGQVDITDPSSPQPTAGYC